MDAVGVAGEGDAPHGVGQVVVEAGDEAEAVLPGQGLAAARAAVGHVHAAGLAAQGVVFVDRDPEAAFGEFVRGGQPGDTPAQYGHAGARGGGGRAPGRP